MQIHLDSYGARLRVKDGLLQVQHADYKGVVQTRQFAAHQVDSIFLRKGTSVSADAILLAMEHSVELIVTDGYGFPVGRFHTHRPSSTGLLQKVQLLTSVQPRGMECVRSWLLEKLMLQESFLRDLLRYRSKAEQQRWQPKLSQLQGLRAKLETAAPEPATFRGLEGSAGRILYYTLGQLLPDRYRFVRRSRRPAQDAFNAFLNYAYALLYVRVETALLEAGLNPYIGFMHRDDYQYKSLVYDFIEPFRITTIRAVYQLFARHKVSGQHVRKEPDGSVWLSTEGKRLLLPHLKTAYEEKTEVRWQMRMTEAWHIRRRASHFAQDLLQEAEIEETAA